MVLRTRLSFGVLFTCRRSAADGLVRFAPFNLSDTKVKCKDADLFVRSLFQQQRRMHEAAVSRLCLKKAQTLPVIDDSLAEVHLEERGRSLHVRWKSGAESCYSSLWIRHHDRSEATFNKSANQLSVSHAEMPTDVRLTDASVDAKDDLILFTSTGDNTGDFQGHIPSTLLKEVEWLRHERFELRGNAPPVSYVPRLKLHPKKDNVDESQTEISALRAAIYHHLVDHGLVVVDTNKTEPNYLNDFTKSVLEVPIFETSYGRLFDVVTKQTPDNIAYTNAGLDLHQDLTYFESPPGLQLLHCISNECTGGDSTIVDAFHVAEVMQKRHPDSFAVLCTVPVFNQKIIPRCNTSSPTACDTECLHIRRLQCMIKLNDKQEVVDVRSTYFTEGPWIMPREKEVPFLMAYKLFHDLLRNDEFMLKFRLQPGHILIMNNRRMMHGRTPIVLDDPNSFRHLQGCYVNIDMFRSKAICSAEAMLSAEREEPRVGNGDLL